MTAPMTREELAKLADYIEREQSCGVDISLSDADAEKIVAALRGGVAQKAGWQPIETKRADHFPVLIDGPYGIHTAFQDVTWTWYVCGGIELDYTPTHWRPLPERASNQGASK